MAIDGGVRPQRASTIVRRARGEATLAELRWELVPPPFATGATGGARAINARAETVLERPRPQLELF